MCALFFLCSSLSCVRSRTKVSSASYVRHALPFVLHQSGTYDPGGRGGIGWLVGISKLGTARSRLSLGHIMQVLVNNK